MGRNNCGVRLFCGAVHLQNIDEHSKICQLALMCITYRYRLAKCKDFNRRCECESEWLSAYAMLSLI